MSSEENHLNLRHYMYSTRCSRYKFSESCLRTVVQWTRYLSTFRALSPRKFGQVSRSLLLHPPSPTPNPQINNFIISRRVSHSLGVRDRWCKLGCGNFHYALELHKIFLQEVLTRSFPILLTNLSSKKSSFLLVPDFSIS